MKLGGDMDSPAPGARGSSCDSKIKGFAPLEWQGLAGLDTEICEFQEMESGKAGNPSLAVVFHIPTRFLSGSLELESGLATLVIFQLRKRPSYHHYDHTKVTFQLESVQEALIFYHLLLLLLPKNRQAVVRARFFGPLHGRRMDFCTFGNRKLRFA